ncbi:MAG: YdeI/OmpD-associated family protein [Planctomycetes bacterium]|nr:YdeI/OmpD-associated family protein [Planctomycetota bacterium]
MGTKDPRVDSYIAKVAPFAKPILTHLRAVVHAACPSVSETIKWGSPSFEYEGILCNMAAFKAHCAFGIWKHDLVVEGDTKAKEAMGSFGRITSLSDLPPKTTLVRYLKKAMKLNEQGIQAARKKTVPKEPIAVHPEFRAALAKSKKARATFDAFPPGHRREYLEWIADAKRDETRARRIATAIEWLEQGKSRNWKYADC